MTRLEKISLIARYYETSIQGARVMIQRGLISGAYAIKNNRRYTYRFEPELIDKIIKYFDKEEK